MSLKHVFPMVTLLAAALLAGCAAEGGAAGLFDGFGGAGACDDARLGAVTWAAELIPAGNAPWVRQEAASVTFSDCRARVAMGPRVDVPGLVLDAQGTTPVTATVIATRPSMLPGRAAVSTQAQTRASGEFLLSLPEGSYTVHVVPQTAGNDPGWPPLTTTVDVSAARKPGDTLVLRLARGVEVRGLVRSAIAAGLAGVKVRAVDPASGGLVSSVATTDAAGAFTLWLSADVQAQSAVRLLADGGPLVVSLARDVPVAGIAKLADPIELRAPAVPDPQRFSIPIIGRSTSGTTMPVQGARVDVTGVVAEAGPGLTAATFSVTGLTDADGLAAELLLPGSEASNRSYTVTVTPPSDSLFARGTFPVVVGAKGGVLSTITLDARASLSGQVVLPTWQPVHNLAITARPVASLGVGPLGDTIPVAPPDATADAEGRFVMRVEHGIYDLDLVPPPTQALPRWTVESVLVREDSDAGIIVLPAGIAAQVQVVAPTGDAAAGVTVRLYAVEGDPCDGAGHCAGRSRLRAEGATSDFGLLRVSLAP